MWPQNLLAGLLGLAVLAEASPFDRILERRALMRQMEARDATTTPAKKSPATTKPKSSTTSHGAKSPIKVAALSNGSNGGKGGNGGNGGNGGARIELCLNPKLINKASTLPGKPDAAAGQSASLFDAANFINFCRNSQHLTNGMQIDRETCNPIPMGKIPSRSKMVSTIFLSPKHNEDVAPNVDFEVVIQITGLSLGRFTAPNQTYYSAPQDLTKDGLIIGHCHVVIQLLGDSANPTVPPNPTDFVFFQGINDIGDGKGRLRTVVPRGLPPGFYRLCSMNAAANHQPVVMPFAQRGAQDDCTKFTVGGGAGKGEAGKVNAGNGGGGGGPPVANAPTAAKASPAAKKASAPKSGPAPQKSGPAPQREKNNKPGSKVT